MLYSCRDITERKHAEEELRAARLDLAHASRLALVGELMASIAHEINQPLTSILSTLGPASPGSAHPGGPARPPSFARSSWTSATRAARRRTSSNASARWPASDRSNGSPSTSTRSSATSCSLWTATRGGGGVTLRADLVPALPAIDADRVCLQQVVLNLILNAMDAMDEPETGERQLPCAPAGWTRRRGRGERHRPRHSR